MNTQDLEPKGTSAPLHTAVVEMPARRDAYGRTLEDALTEDTAWRAVRSAAAQRRIDRATLVLTFAPCVVVLGPLTQLLLLLADVAAFCMHRTWGFPSPPFPLEAIEPIEDLLQIAGVVGCVLLVLATRLLRERWVAEAKREGLDVKAPPLPGTSSDPETANEVNQDT